MPFLAPVVAAVSSFLAGAASFLGGLGFIGKAIVGIGLSLAAKAFQKKPKNKAVTGSKLEVQYGADQPREIALGLVGIAGHDIYTNTYGKANKNIVKVFVLSDFRIDGLERLAVNGNYVPLGADDGDKGKKVLGDFEDQLWVKLYKGLSDQQADPYLRRTANPTGRWTAAHRLSGVAYAIVTAEWDDEKMNSFPQLLFEIRGAPLYDVRRDGSAGGSGSHRWADQSTWEYGNGIGTNPIVQAYCYERGFATNGELIIGKGMPASDLPPAAWMAAANVCDEPVDGKARYRAGCLITAADGITHTDNLQPILEAAGAMLVEKVDGDQPIVGANQPVVATLTDDDLIVGASHRFQAKRSRSQLINGVFGSYNNPDDLWSATAYTPTSNAVALAADRERHAVQLDWEAVYDLGQAVRLTQYAARASVVTDPPRDTIWSREWRATTLAEDLAFELARLQDEIRDLLAGGREAQDDFDARLQELARNIALITGRTILDVGDISARLIDEQTVRVAANETLARRTTGVETRLGSAELGIAGQSVALQTLESRTTTAEGKIETNANATTAVQARLQTAEGTLAGQAQTLSSLSATVSQQDSRIVAVAEAVTGVRAETKEAFADGLISFKAVATGPNAYARVAILVRARGTDGFIESGLYLEASGGSSTILARADKFIVTDGNAATIPLVYENGVLKLAIARFRQLQSDSGRMLIDGSAGRILMADAT